MSCAFRMTGAKCDRIVSRLCVRVSVAQRSFPLSGDVESRVQLRVADWASGGGGGAVAVGVRTQRPLHRMAVEGSLTCFIVFFDRVFD